MEKLLDAVNYNYDIDPIKPISMEIFNVVHADRPHDIRNIPIGDRKIIFGGTVLERNELGIQKVKYALAVRTALPAVDHISARDIPPAPVSFG